MTMASAVMITGRQRTNPASRAAAVASPSSASRSRAKLITSTELAVATPMHMMAPVSAGTDKRRVRHEQHPDDARQRRRQRRDDDERIRPGLEIHNDQQVDQGDRSQQAEQQPSEGAVHGPDLSLQLHRPDLGRALRRELVDDTADVGGDGAEIPALHGGIDLHHRIEIVLR